MATTISWGLQKGGIGKTTVTSISAYLLAKEHKVLAVDFDSQGNLTQMLTQRNIYDFDGRTALEACKEEDPRPYITQVSNTLFLLPAEDKLASLPQYLYSQKYRFTGKHPTLCLQRTLDVVKSDYDYICIDLPPHLGDQTTNGIAASDYVVALLQSDPFCYDALDRFLELIQVIKDKLNPSLQLAGILTSMMDGRMTLDNTILERAREEYEDIVFESVVKRRSRIKEYSITGIQDATKADREALEPYVNFIKELIQRV